MAADAHKNEKAERLQQRLAGLRRTYVLKFPEKCEQMESLLNAYFQSRKEEAINDLRHAAHKLKGSGATYGFDEISECAMVFELHLAKMLKSEDKIKMEKDDAVGLRRELDLLKDAMMRAAAGTDI